MSYDDSMARYADLLYVHRPISNASHARLDYSEKMRKQSDSETPNGQALWQLAEFDHTCKFHNCLVEPQPVATVSGIGVKAAPTAMTVDRQGVVSAEICSPLRIGKAKDDAAMPDDEDPIDWDRWCRHIGINCRIWTPEQIGATTELRACLDVLYRHVRMFPAERALEKRLVAKLGRDRTLQLKELKKGLDDDPQAVVSAVARLLMRGSIFSDLNIKPKGEFLRYGRDRSFMVPSGFRFSEVTLLSTVDVFSA